MSDSDNSSSSNDNPYTSAVQKFSRISAIQSAKHRNELTHLNQMIADNSDDPEPVKNSRNPAQKREAGESNVTSSKIKKKPMSDKNSCEPRVLRRSLRIRKVVNYNEVSLRRQQFIAGM